MSPIPQETIKGFLSDHEYRQADLPKIQDMQPLGLILGQGTPALEVVVYRAKARPSGENIRTIWKKRWGGRGVPLVIVGLYDDTCVVCGHTERSHHPAPVWHDLPVEHVERLCDTALRLPDHHAVDRFLRDHLPESDSSIFGIHNRGLLATYVLQRGREDVDKSTWDHAAKQSAGLRGKRDRNLLTSLGFSIESLTGPASILTVGKSRTALALFLDQNETAELPSQRFSNQTPVSYALQLAQAHNLDWVIVNRGSELRLYPTRTDVGVGRRGLTDTYLSIDLELLTDDRLPFVWLAFSADGLTKDGHLAGLREKSERYAKGIGERLRDRIYDSVIPQLAKAIVKARDLKQPSTDDLDLTYQMAMLVLFRLLFVAYAEDHDLLPYRTNELYRSRSLTKLARDLRKIKQEARGFDVGTSLWDEINILWNAVRQGHSEWDIPPYDGGLFEDDKDHPAGAALAEIKLSNRDFGVILSSLLLDEDTPEGLAPVDFRALGVREFGTIYEGLLENELSVAETNLTTDKKGNYKPTEDERKIEVHEEEIYLHNRSGARKASGSYYTKSFAVAHLLDHSLEPALDEHLERVAKTAKSDSRKAGKQLFDFFVADIAMGSGHFLVAAIDRIEKRFLTFLGETPLKSVDDELEKLRSAAIDKLGEAVDERRLEKNQLLRRLIARRCVFGVDINPLAVELARLSIWIHTFVPGLPLSFLDHNLVCGNSLVGIATFEEISEEAIGVGETLSLFHPQLKSYMGDSADRIRTLRELSDATIQDIEEAKEAHSEARRALLGLEALFDIVTAKRIDKSFNAYLPSGIAGLFKDIKTLDDLFGISAHKKATEATKTIPPFHFPVAFPEIFLREQPGFDVIIGNPPWEEATLEQDAFWARHFPGLRGMNQTDQEILKRKYREDRPDLARQLEQEIEENKLLRRVLTTGPYPGMGTGDPDLYKAFCWRFWNLVRQNGGRIGVVLPRSAWFAKGSELIRKEVFRDGGIEVLTYLLNNRKWVFPEVHPQYTVVLSSVVKMKGLGRKHSIALRGPYRSRMDFDTGMTRSPIRFKASDVLNWTDTASLPLLPSEESAEVFLQLRKAPRLDADIGDWRCRPHTELHATNDKKIMTLTSDPPKGYWPVYKGESFDIWTPDTGKYYAWVDPEEIMEHLQKKRERGHKNKRSAFNEFSDEWIRDRNTLPCLHPRIAFRDVTNRTNQRTVIVALVPPEVAISNQAPFLLWPKGDSGEAAYLLAVLSSIPLDWYSRCYVETHVNFHVLSPFPIPRPNPDSILRSRAIRLAGRLASPDKRFAEFARAVGVICGPLPEDEKEDMIHELDAVVAHLYGLKQKHLRHIFETFHEGWDYEERLRATLKHFQEWKKRL